MIITGYLKPHLVSEILASPLQRALFAWQHIAYMSL